MKYSVLTGKFFGKLITEYNNGNTWTIRQLKGEEFGMFVDGVGNIVPEDGFKFDFASIPPVIRWFYPKAGTGRGGCYGEPSAIHDLLYSYPEKFGVDQKTADKIFLLGMELKKVRLTMRSLFYAAVRIGGKKYFGKPNKLNKMRGVN